MCIPELVPKVTFMEGFAIGATEVFDSSQGGQHGEMAGTGFV
jgi:hypothetical protein